MVLLEAWACGKPVLMTPQCNMPEGFEAGAALRIEPEEEKRAGGARSLSWPWRTRSAEAMGAKGRALVRGAILPGR